MESPHRFHGAPLLRSLLQLGPSAWHRCTDRRLCTTDVFFHLIAEHSAPSTGTASVENTSRHSMYHFLVEKYCMNTDHKLSCISTLANHLAAQEVLATTHTLSLSCKTLRYHGSEVGKGSRSRMCWGGD